MSSDKNGQDLADYEVYGTFPDGTEECIGNVTLPEKLTVLDMPIELEIDGVVYKPQF